MENLNPVDKAHQLFAEIQDAKTGYISANNNYNANPTQENLDALTAAAKEHEAAVKRHNAYKESDEYKDHLTGKTVAGFEVVYRKDDQNNTYTPTLVKISEEKSVDEPVDEVSIEGEPATEAEVKPKNKKGK